MGPRRIWIIVALLWLALLPRAASADDEQPQEPPQEPAAAQVQAAQAEQVAPQSPEDAKEYSDTFAGVGDVSEASATGEGEQALAPTLTAEQLRKMVAVARKKTLDKMQAKMEAKSAERMGKISALIGWVSLAGLLLLLMPLFLKKKYPGQGAALFKYSALAAVTFVVTVNLFGGVVLVFRGAQAQLGAATNPQLQIAAAFFDTIDKNADDFLVVGSELFAPTLAHLQGDSDEQPAVVLFENGKKLLKDADVFVAIAKAFKKLDFVFAALPTVLLLVTMLLFIRAIKPTLMEIIRLPITAASGAHNAGRNVVKKAMRRVGGELVATLMTIGVLVVLTIFAGMLLGRIVGPALEALIGYFSLAVIYLQYVENASSGLVFVMLFGVIIFLVLNLAAVIASMSLFLGKAQKIFQRRCNDGVPLRQHLKFWKWGAPSVAIAQVLPWLFILVADWTIGKLDDKLAGDGTDPAKIHWAAIMLLGPALLVLGFVAFYWAGRGLKSLGFLAKYKVDPPAAPAQQLEPVGIRVA